MATIKSIVGSRTQINWGGSGFPSTLASATYAASDAWNCTTNDPLDVWIEIEVATTNTPAGNKQLLVFVQGSLDNSNFETGPVSGTTTTDEPDLTPVGAVPMNTASTTHRKIFSVAAAFGGVLPQAFKIVIRNDLGVALTSGNAFVAEVSGDVT